MHINVGNLTVIGSDNILSPGRHQGITWTNAGILLISSLATNFSQVLIEIHTFSFEKMHLKMSSGKWRPFCLGRNVLKQKDDVSNPNKDFRKGASKYNISYINLTKLMHHDWFLTTYEWNLTQQTLRRHLCMLFPYKLFWYESLTHWGQVTYKCQ